VNDSSGVRGIERVGDLDAKREQSVQFHGTPGNALLHRLGWAQDETLCPVIWASYSHDEATLQTIVEQLVCISFRVFKAVTRF
jgi:hypothetical protein